MKQLIKKDHELKKIENTFMSYKFLQQNIKHQLIESFLQCKAQKKKWEKR